VLKRLTTPILLYCIIFIFWLIYRSITPTPPEWLDNFVTKPAVWIIPVFFVVKILEKRSIISLGLSWHHFYKFSLIGITAGILFFVYLKSFEFVFHQSEFHFSIHSLNFSGVLASLAFGIATAFTEELVFRGYLQSRLTKIFNSHFIGIAISTPLFALIHIPIAVFVYHYNLQKILFYEIYLLEVSILYALHFMYSKNLTSSVAAHATIDFLSDIIP
jgi:hypothetical protein